MGLDKSASDYRWREVAIACCFNLSHGSADATRGMWDTPGDSHRLSR